MSYCVTDSKSNFLKKLLKFHAAPPVRDRKKAPKYYEIRLSESKKIN